MSIQFSTGAEMEAARSRFLRLHGAGTPAALVAEDGRILSRNASFSQLGSLPDEPASHEDAFAVCEGLRELVDDASRLGWSTGPVTFPRGVRSRVTVCRGVDGTLLVTSPEVRSAPGDEKTWLRAVFDEAPNAMALLSLEGRYLDVNRAWCQLLGYTRQEAIQLSYRDVAHADDAPQRASRRRPEAATLDVVRRFLHKSGRIVWVEVHGAIVHDAHGVPRYAVSQIQDVTERRKTLSALAESEARFRATFDQAPAGVALVAPSGRVLQANPALCRILGTSAEALSNTSFSAALGLAPGEFEACLHTARDGRIIAPMEREVGTPGGVRWCRIQVAPVINSRGETTHLLAHVSDESAARAQEAREQDLSEQLQVSQRMEAVGRLAGGIAHDFNNMLSIILSYTELARRRVSDTRAIEHLHAVTNAAERSAALTRQLMIFGRRDVVSAETVDLNQILHLLEPLLTRTLGSDLTLELELDAQLPPAPLAAARAEQIVMNLALNARDAMPGGGTLRFRTAARPADGAPRVVLSVEDTGTGIEPDALEHIFEPFFTTKAVGQGTGLGLSIVYGIVRDAGGTISARSQIGRGTRFEIELPSAPPAPAPAVATPDAQATGGKGERLLFVEDEALLRDVVSEVLADSGYTVVAFDRPYDALDWLQSHDDAVDLLLTDVMMPGLTGDQMAARAQALRPGLRVIFLSGDTDDRVRTFRKQHDATAEFLQKPFAMDELLAMIRRRIDEPRE